MGYTHFVLAMPEHIRGSTPTTSPEKAVERYRAYYNACAGVVCASARAKQSIKGLAQHSVKIDGPWS